MLIERLFDRRGLWRQIQRGCRARNETFDGLAWTPAHPLHMQRMQPHVISLNHEYGNRIKAARRFQRVDERLEHLRQFQMAARGFCNVQYELRAGWRPVSLLNTLLARTLH